MAKRTISNPKEDAFDSKNAVRLVNRASDFRSLIMLEVGGKQVNLKSLMGVMTLGGIPHGQVCIVATGSDEDAALQAVAQLIQP